MTHEVQKHTKHDSRAFAGFLRVKKYSKIGKIVYFQTKIGKIGTHSKNSIKIGIKGIIGTAGHPGIFVSYILYTA